MDRVIAQELLEAARAAQTVFWEALQELEGELGFDVDGLQDLDVVDLDDLLEAADKDEDDDDPEHSKDEDCDVDPETWLCRGCGADHSLICTECGGRGFHKQGCSLSDASN